MGVPSSITTFLFDLDYIVIDHLMAEYNDIALAAAGIVLLPLNIGIGICQGMNGIVWSQSAADVLTVALSVAVYRSYEKKLHPN